MFDITLSETGTVLLSGRLDASQVAVADTVLDTLEESSVIDFSSLEYISSAGLGVLLKTQQRLNEREQALTLTGLNPHIRMVFDLAGFDLVFTIE